MTGCLRIGTALTAISALVLASTPAVARNLVRIHQSEQGSVVMLDLNSIAAEGAEGSGIRTAIVSIDNSRVRTGVQFIAADLKIRAQCRQRRLTVLRYQAFDSTGAPLATGSGITPSALVPADSAAERAILEEVCKAP